MLDKIFKDTVFSEFDEETQELLLKTRKAPHIVFWITAIGSKFLLLFLFVVPSIIFEICEDKPEEQLAYIAISIFAMVTMIAISGFMLYFKDAFFVLDNIISSKMYFLFVTKRGKALSRVDFKKIKAEKEKTYRSIEISECSGHCYSVCFSLLQILKQGTMNIVAIRQYTFNDPEENEENEYTLHALFERNGWVYDTNDNRQYKMTDYYEWNKVKTCKMYGYEDVKDMTYEEFLERERPEIHKWCQENDCAEDFQNPSKKNSP